MQYIRIYYILAVLLLLSGSVTAQDKTFLEPRFGFGTFRMTSMKELQQTVIQASEVNAKATDSFSPYFQYGLGYLVDVKEDLRTGAFVERGSTGGRVHYEDYSGEIRFDTPVNYTAMGIILYRHKPLGTGSLRYVTGLETNLFYNQLKMQVYSRIYESSESSEEKYVSLGLGLKPYVGLQYPVYNFPVQLTLGYMASYNQPFHKPGEPDYQLARNNNNETLEPSWSGLRINLGITFPIFK